MSHRLLVTEGPTGPDSESSLLPLHSTALLREIPVWESLLASFFHYFFLLSLTLSWQKDLASLPLNSLSFLTETGPPDSTFDNWPLSLLSLHLGPACRCPIIGPLGESNWLPSKMSWETRERMSYVGSKGTNYVLLPNVFLSK